MIKAKHTPGPWRLEPKLDHDGHKRRSIWSDARGMVGYVYGDNNPARADADAHLFAAAPDLLAALKALEPYLDHIPGGIGAEIDHARDAIARAEGRLP